MGAVAVHSTLGTPQGWNFIRTMDLEPTLTHSARGGESRRDSRGLWSRESATTARDDVGKREGHQAGYDNKQHHQGARAEGLESSSLKRPWKICNLIHNLDWVLGNGIIFKIATK